MKRKFGTMINPSAVGNPIVRAFERAVRALIRAQARWRGKLSRILLVVEGNTVTYGSLLGGSENLSFFSAPRNYY